MALALYNVSVTLSPALSKLILDVHPWSDSTEFRGIGRGSSDCHSSTPSLYYAVAVMSEVFVNKRVDDRVHSII